LFFKIVPSSPVKRPDPTPPISTGKRARIDKPSTATQSVKRLRRSTNNLLQTLNTEKTSNCETAKQKDSENTVPVSNNVVASPEPMKPEVQPTKKRSCTPTPPISVSASSTETETTTPKSSVKTKALNVICDDDSKRRPANTVSMNEVIKLHQVKNIIMYA
jgi:hypothetical protein